MERGQFVQDLLLSTLLMDKVDLSGDFLQSVEDEFYVPSGRYLCIYMFVRGIVMECLSL